MGRSTAPGGRLSGGAAGAAGGLGRAGADLVQLAAPGALAGDYVGASAEASAGVGVGANLLVGGSDESFTLQPVSVQTQTGVNLALGVTSFELRSAQ